MINWIKVADRLPPQESALITRSKLVMVIYYTNEHLFEFDFDFYLHSTGEWLMGITPTHWANLSDINLPND